jgi:hypothetical protein
MISVKVTLPKPKGRGWETWTLNVLNDGSGDKAVGNYDCLLIAPGVKDTAMCRVERFNRTRGFEALLSEVFARLAEMRGETT